MRRRVYLGALGAVGLAWAIGGEYFSIRDHVTENHFLDGLVGVSLILSGLIAWDRRPDSRVGKLLVLSGFTWFLGNYGHAHVTFLFAVGYGLNGFSIAPLAHAVIAYPTGRLKTLPERAVISAIYVWELFIGILTIVTFDPVGRFGCTRCPHAGLPYIRALMGLHTAADHVDSVMGIALPTLAVVVLLLRLRRETPAVRRNLAPLWIAGLALTAAFIAQGISDALHLTGVPQSAINATQRMLNIAVPIALLIGLLRIRLVRTTIGDMVVAIGEQPGPGQLRDALARALGDPDLQVVYAMPAAGGYVDAAGRRAYIPEDPRTVTVLSADGEPIAALIHDPVLSEQREIVEAAGAAARLAIQNERLRAEVRAQLEEVRASRARIVEAGDEERRRVERDLHDGAQQRLLSLSLAMRLAEQRLGPEPDPELRRTIEAAKSELDRAIDEIRELARGIHPAILTDEGLGAALESLAERAPVPTKIVSTPDERFAPQVEATAYFVVSEAVSNAAKHAAARAVTVSAERCDGQLRVSIADDGKGGAEVTGGTGLRGLIDRVAAVGGKLSIESSPGNGTRIDVEIPCA